jgi:hypothetical protein
MGKANNGSVIPPTTTVTVNLTLTLAEANDLLVALANAINNAGSKGKGGGKAPAKGSPATGNPKGGPAPKTGKAKG